MPIAFACPQCEKTYQVSDGLAGKKGRCKECGSVFLVPSAAAPEPDLYGLDDGPAVSGPSATGPSRGDDLVGRGARPAAKPRKPSAAAGVDHENQEQFRRAGSGLIFFGFLTIFLPLVGFQHQVLVLLDPAIQRAVGVLTIIAGAGTLAISFATRPMRVLKYAALGFAGLVALVVMIAVATHGDAQPDLAAKPPTIQPGPPPPIVPRPAPAPVAEGSKSMAPIDAGVADTLLFTLSNAQVERDANPGATTHELAFRVDYQKTDAPVGNGGALYWLVESPRARTERRMIVDASGSATLSGSISLADGDTGPFTTSIARDTVGPGGRSRVKVSNVARVAWNGAEAPATEPSQPQPPSRPRLGPGLGPGRLGGPRGPMSGRP